MSKTGKRARDEDDYEDVSDTDPHDSQAEEDEEEDDLQPPKKLPKTQPTKRTPDQKRVKKQPKPKKKKYQFCDDDAVLCEEAIVRFGLNYKSIWETYFKQKGASQNQVKNFINSPEMEDVKEDAKERHAKLKAERKNLFLSSVRKEREKIESQQKPEAKEVEPPVATKSEAQKMEPVSIFGKPVNEGFLIQSKELMTSQPLFVASGNIYAVMFKHVLGSQCYIDLDPDQKIVTFRVVHSAYLVPREFKKTKFFQEVDPGWTGRFDNFNTEIKAYTQLHPFQLPADTNMENINVKRFDHQTCTSWLVEVHFQKTLSVATHLMPKASLWEILEEDIKKGRGQDEVFEQEVRKAS